MSRGRDEYIWGRVEGVCTGVGIPRSHGIPPLVLTPISDHQNSYGWQAGSMHPIGMLSCCNYFASKNFKKKFMEVHSGHFCCNRKIIWKNVTFWHSKLKYDSTFLTFERKKYTSKQSTGEFVILFYFY